MPVEVGQGVLCYVRGPGAAEGPEREVLELMGRAGELITLDDEPLIEPAMALMSCGPAFMALWAESFAKAGEAHGLDRQAAMRMVVETMAGSAAWLTRHGYDGAELRARVATPGGTTEQGLIALEDGGLGDLVQATVDQVVEATR
jgi:pyrroline-5-carboxylate reductase